MFFNSRYSQHLLIIFSPLSFLRVKNFTQHRNSRMTPFWIIHTANLELCWRILPVLRSHRNLAKKKSKHTECQLVAVNVVPQDAHILRSNGVHRLYFEIRDERWFTDTLKPEFLTCRGNLRRGISAFSCREPYHLALRTCHNVVA